MDSERDPFLSIPSSRRAFIKKMVAAAFVAPMIGSFGLDELASATAPHHDPHHKVPNQHYPNQYYPNQTPGPCVDDVKFEH